MRFNLSCIPSSTIGKKQQNQHYTYDIQALFHHTLNENRFKDTNFLLLELPRKSFLFRYLYTDFLT